MFSHLTKDFFGNKQSFSIGLAFISVGLLFGSWATFIPLVKLKFNLNDAELGVLLLSLPFGALIMNPLAAWLIRRLGMRHTTLLGLVFLILAFAVLLNTPTLFFQAMAMFLCGSGIAITNVGMNTCVGAIEHHFGINIISTCHGMFSVGLMGGSLAASFFGGLGVLPGLFLVGLCGGLGLVFLYIRPIILSILEEKKQFHEKVGSKFSFPSGTFLMMVIISLCINITEGSMADWTAVFMRDVVHTNPFFEGWGMAGYSFFMALGRLIGDKIIPKYGVNAILKYGGILSIFGIVVAISWPFTFTAILGFAFVGAGVSCGAPILYASASRVPNMAQGAGLAMMNTFAMGGFLFGPVLIGFISKATSLSLAFGFIAFLGLVWVFYAGRVKLY
jgi:MFS family permease